MKKFKNKVTEITRQKKDGFGIENIGFADLAKISLDTPPQGGWTTSEMRSRLNVEAKLTPMSLEDEIDLEDAEFGKLVECLNVGWQFKHKDIIVYEDYILELKKNG